MLHDILNANIDDISSDRWLSVSIGYVQEYGIKTCIAKCKSYVVLCA
jgi:hypothetical protein